MRGTGDEASINRAFFLMLASISLNPLTRLVVTDLLPSRYIDLTDSRCSASPLHHTRPETPPSSLSLHQPFELCLTATSIILKVEKKSIIKGVLCHPPCKETLREVCLAFLSSLPVFIPSRPLLNSATIASLLDVTASIPQTCLTHQFWSCQWAEEHRSSIFRIETEEGQVRGVYMVE